MEYSLEACQYQSKPMVSMSDQINFTANKLYQYHSRHPDNFELKLIIKTNKKLLRHDMADDFLYACYNDLFNQNIICVVRDIIVESNIGSTSFDSIDEFLICKIAVTKNMYDIIELLIEYGFDLNHSFIKAISIHRCLDILAVAVKENNFKMCQFLVEKGATPVGFRCSALSESCKLVDDTIFDYLMQFDIPQQTLGQLLFSSFNISDDNRSIFDFQKIKKMLEKGLNLNNLDFGFHSIIFGKCTVDQLQYFLDNGLVIKSNVILLEAIHSKNKELVDYLLDYGLVIDEKMLDYIFASENVSIILFLAEINVDLSVIKLEKKYDSVINKLTERGLDKNVLLNYLFASTEPNLFNSMKKIK